jgi:hypothetical protein
MKKIVFTRKNEIEIDGEWAGTIEKDHRGYYVSDVLCGEYFIPIQADTKEGLRRCVEWALKEVGE